MNLFELNLVAFGDNIGLGVYEVGHFLQHQQYAQILTSQGVNFPNFDILHMRVVDPNEWISWLNAHENLHALLRGQSNVTGVDLSSLDLNSQEQWEWWQEAHRFEHSLFDQHFGTT